MSGKKTVTAKVGEYCDIPMAEKKGLRSGDRCYRDCRQCIACVICYDNGEKEHRRIDR